MTKRQQDLIAVEDWRHYAVDFMGDGLGMLATSENIDSRLISFSLPSAPALFLNISRKHHDMRSVIDIMGQFNANHGNTFWPESHSLVFDYLENFAAEVIFAYAALESFSNEIIPADFKYNFRRSKKSEEEIAKPDIERFVSLDEKLKRVIPQAHNLKSPASSKHWASYKKLRQMRDRIVHLKSIDRRSSGPEHQTLWAEMISRRYENYPKIAVGVVGFFEELTKNRRWYRLAAEQIL